VDDIAYDTDTLEEARTVVAGEAERMPVLANRWAATPPPDLGGLDAARALVDALAALTRALVADLDAAGARLREAARALDATVRLVRGTEGANTELLAPVGR
jgi:hypothetical protein